MPRVYAPCFAVALSLLASYPSVADEPPAKPPLADPTVLLLWDDSVRSALALSADQRATLDTLLDKHNRMLLAIRDVGLAGADKSVQPALGEIRTELTKLLSDAQRGRLQGLILQAQGYDGLLRNDVVAALKLTAAQQHQLAKISENFRNRAQALRTDGVNRSPDAFQAALAKLQADRHKQILARLEPPQTERWSQLLGEPFDFTQVRTGPALAPEFDDVEVWINSPPLTMKSLRGRVVVVHFFAFGCHNCINNYPWYREWYAGLADKGVTIVGIHTPETQAETDNDQLRLSLDKHGLKFPVAVDKQKTMWQAWNNNIWPAVYIIDKRGRLRYWWYGELDWQGAGNQANARRQIEQLLAEPAPNPSGNTVETAATSR